MILASRLSRVFVAVVILAGVGLVVQRAVRARGTAADSAPDVRAAIDASNEAYLDALKRGDAEAYASIFTRDAVSIPARGSMLRGRDAIRASISEAFKRIDFRDGAIRTTETRIDGSTAFEIGRYTFDITADGEPATLAGHYVVAWQKRGDSWKIAVDASQPHALA